MFNCVVGTSRGMRLGLLVLTLTSCDGNGLETPPKAEKAPQSANSDDFG